MAFRVKSAMMRLKNFSEECLFQIIKRDKEPRIKITVQAITINEFDGVQSGMLIVLYQAIPTSAK
jgi:hypothetical protein